MSDLRPPEVDDPSGFEASRHRRRKTYLIAAVSIAALAIISVVYAASSSPSAISGKVDTSHLPDAGPTPAIAAKGWINSKPLTAAALKGKVVVYDFWTYSCINCVRTFPEVRALYNRYRRDGLVVVGVHSPEFDFEKVPANVQAATKRLHVTWPVALDPEMAIWGAFNNRYWPADYIADRRGHIRYQHFGEGDYANTENVVRRLLGVKKSAPRASEDAKAETASGQQVNPETYLDASHGQVDVQAGLRTYPDPGSVAAPLVALEGTWDGADEKITAAAGGRDDRCRCARGVGEPRARARRPARRWTSSSCSMANQYRSRLEVRAFTTTATAKPS